MTITDLRITHFPPTLTQIVDAQGTLSNMATWDVWKAQAVKARAPEELAALGRETVRDYQQYGRAAGRPRTRKANSSALTATTCAGAP